MFLFCCDCRIDMFMLLFYYIHVCLYFTCDIYFFKQYAFLIIWR